MDGPLELAQIGFARELVVESTDRGLLLIFDSEIERDGCSKLMVWDALPSGSDGFVFEAFPAVTLPADAVCGVDEHGLRKGRLTVQGDALRLRVQGSEFCRGLDVDFGYRKVPDRAPSERDILRRYVALFNRRRAPELTSLFAQRATLVEPFSRAAFGVPARHEGRAAIARWFARAFAGSRWSAMRLLEIRPGSLPDSWLMEFQYMDSELSAPFRGRTLFVFGAGQIFLAELQRVEPAVPALTMHGPRR